MEEVQEDLVLDTTGLFCPEPVMMLHSKIDDMNPAEIVKVLATDPSTKRDFTKFCTFLGHEIIKSVEVNNIYEYWIKKGRLLDT